jgi:tRNA pseudouridine55 synthase
MNPPILNGLLLVNKPIGITSFDVIRALRRQTGVKKIGHAGTLDPLATGLMLMLFGTTCKQAMSLTKLDKRYLGEVTLGATSTTGDSEGEKTPISDRKPSLTEVTAAILKFRGEIIQTPSIYSAIKVNGQEAYKYARAGRDVELPTRQVTVYELELVAYEYPIIKLNAKVSSGTYIRSLATDIGETLGVGGFLSTLIRTEVGEYSLSDAVELENQDFIISKGALLEI